MRPTPPSTTVGAPPRCDWIGRLKGRSERPAAPREADTAAAAVGPVDEEHNDGHISVPGHLDQRRMGCPMAAFILAAAAGGAVKTVKTTPWLTIEEGIEALRKASGTGYRLPGSEGVCGR